MTDHVRITEEEWQAVHLAARALREVGGGLSRSGAETLATESIRNAAVLEALGRRSVVMTAMDSCPEPGIERER